MENTKNTPTKGQKFREELKRMSREDILEYRRSLSEWEVNDTKDTQYRTEIEKMSSEVGCPTVNDFLIRLRYIPDPSVKKPRTKITKETRENIVNDLKSEKMTTKEISEKYGVTTDSIYNIKGKNGLTKTREKLVLVKTKETKDGTVIVPEPSSTENPTTGFQPTEEQKVA